MNSEPDAKSVREALKRSNPLLVDANKGERRAAVTLLLRSLGGEVDVLFVRRAEVEGDPWSGHMALPGGHMDPTDIDLIETARRETLEEVGVKIERDNFLGQLHDMHPVNRKLPPITISAFVAWLDGDVTVTGNHEVQYHVWIPYTELGNPSNASEVEYHANGQDFVLPSIVYQGDVIWGLTHRIVMNLCEILREEVGV